MNVEQVAMKLFSKAGEGRSYAMDAIQAARENDIDRAKSLLKKSDYALLEGHEVHTQLLVEEANDSKLDFSILLVHSLEHIMNAMTVRDLAEEFVLMYEERGKK